MRTITADVTCSVVCVSVCVGHAYVLLNRSRCRLGADNVGPSNHAFLSLTVTVPLCLFYSNKSHSQFIHAFIYVCRDKHHPKPYSTATAGDVINGTSGTQSGLNITEEARCGGGGVHTAFAGYPVYHSPAS